MHRIAAIGVLLLLLCTCVPAHAQQLSPRIGFGLTTTVTTDFANPIGLGLHVRGSLPVNPDLSFATGIGVTGFVFSGRDDAAYYVTPQVLAIVTLNAMNARAPYVLLGLGGYLPVGGGSDEKDGGPAIHGGLGWAARLQETSVYLEVTPALVVGKDASKLILPLKVGVVM